MYQVRLYFLDGMAHA